MAMSSQSEFGMLSPSSSNHAMCSPVEALSAKRYGPLPLSLCDQSTPPAVPFPPLAVCVLLATTPLISLAALLLFAPRDRTMRSPLPSNLQSNPSTARGDQRHTRQSNTRRLDKAA